MITGFEAYYTYISLKNIVWSKSQFSPNIIYSNGSYKDKLKKSWNSNRVNMDGMFFLQIEESFPEKRDLYNLYLSYYIKNPNFYVKEILDNNFQTYNNYKRELNNHLETFKNDYINYEGDLKKFLYGKPLPDILLSNFSFVSKFMLEKMARYTNKININSLNNIEKEVYYNWFYMVKSTEIVYNNWYKEKFDRQKLLNYFEIANNRRNKNMK